MPRLIFYQILKHKFISTKNFIKMLGKSNIPEMEEDEAKRIVESMTEGITGEKKEV